MIKPYEVPEGWHLVPVKPTVEMKRAGLAERHDDLAASIYGAMLEAAPVYSRPRHANPPADAVPCGTHPDNDGLDDYREPR